MDRLIVLRRMLDNPLRSIISFLWFYDLMPDFNTGCFV
jgi:hypothetical protein